MSSLFSEETKRRLESNLLNQLATPPVNLESDLPHQNRTRLFSPGELFSVLYGKTRLQQASKEVLSSQGTTQLVAAAGLNTACEFCQRTPQGRCSMHRQPTKTQSNKEISYSMKSLPPACKLCPSSAAGEGYGVYTNQDIPEGTWIGPYEGRRIRPCDVTPNMDTSHMWEIYEGTALSHYIDGSDENTASWMRFIRCARHKDEQNLFAFQYNGDIYYRAFKNIPYKTELLVWYDENYPMYMGIPLEIQVGPVYTPSTSTNPQDSRNALTRSKSLPPLIPTYPVQQKQASVDSALPEQRSPTVSNLESSDSNPGNRKVPSPTSSVTELTSWQCQQCHKTFTQRVALQIHVCPSQPTKPFQCGQCSSTFNNSSELRAHVVSHTSERPFKCGFCSRAFVGATTLNNHVRTHMGQKPFACEKCGKTFSQAIHLAKHAKESCECGNSPSSSDMAAPQPLTT